MNEQEEIPKHFSVLAGKILESLLTFIYQLNLDHILSSSGLRITSHGMSLCGKGSEGEQ
jgi:hypothetical protein